MKEIILLCLTDGWAFCAAIALLLSLGLSAALVIGSLLGKK